MSIAPGWTIGEDPSILGERLRLKVRLAAVVVVGALIVAAGITLLLVNTVRLRDGADTALRGDSYLLAVVSLERLVVDAETGLRGYVITGRPLFLAPLRSAQAELPTVIGTLRRAAAAEHLFQTQATALVATAQSYFSDYLPDRIRMVSSDSAQARSLLSTLEGKHRVDQVRVRASALEASLEVQASRRARDNRRSAAASIDEAIIVLVLLTLLTALLGAFLRRIAIQRDTARERSERTAHTLQQSILPSELRSVPGTEVAVRFHPAGAGELVGGDFYDLFEVGPGRWVLMLGDVCGKGAGAAAVTAMARWTLRALSGPQITPAQALAKLNREMLMQSRDKRFITMAYVTLTVEGDAVHAAVACAGHPAPVLVPADGPVRELEVGGDIVGVWKELRLHTDEVCLRRGDALVVFSDGVTDQGTTEPSRSPAEALRERSASAGAEELAEIVDRLACATVSPQRDDIAIMAIRVT